MKGAILLVDDDPEFLSTLAGQLERSEFTVGRAAGAAEAWDLFGKRPWHAVITDLRMETKSIRDGLDLAKKVRDKAPQTLIIVLTGIGDEAAVDEAFRIGAFDFIRKSDSIDGRLGIVLKRARQYIDLQLRLEQYESPMLGSSRPMRELRQRIEELAAEDDHVLITGPTGSGKELVARELYFKSSRRGKPFETCNSAALNSTVGGPELFGSVAGSFTGALADKEGLCETADTGVLFLDEFGDLPHSLYPALLRFLEYNEVRPLGGKTKIVDVRVIAATNSDLNRMVEKGTFRRDILERFPCRIEVPSLDSRSEDVPALAKYFLTMHCARKGTAKEISEDALQLLASRKWPGNIRQLRNFMGEIARGCKSALVSREDVAARMSSPPNPDSGEDFTFDGFITPWAEAKKMFEARYVHHAMSIARRKNGNKRVGALKIASDMIGLGDDTIRAALSDFERYFPKEAMPYLETAQDRPGRLPSP